MGRVLGKRSAVIIHAVWGVIGLLCLAIGFLRGRDSVTSTEQVTKNTELKSTTRPSSSSRVAGNSSQLTHDFLNEFFAEQDEVRSSLAFSAIISSLDESNAVQVAQRLRDAFRRDQDLQHYYLSFLRAWSERDPYAVLSFLGPLGEVNPRCLCAVVAGWVRSDPLAAKSWIDDLPLEKSNDRVRSSYFSSMARHDLAGVTAELYAGAEAFDATQEANEKTYDGPGDASSLKSGYLMKVIAREVIKKGRGQAIGWVEQLPEGSLKAFAFREVAGSFTDEENRALTMDWIKKWSHTESAIGAAGDLIFRLSKEELPAAAVWASELESYGREGSLPHAIDQWAGHDPHAASEFLTTLPADEIRDASAWRLIGKLRWNDLPASLEWAQTIQPSYMRTDALELVASRWLNLDPSQASQWIENSELPAESQTRLFKEYEESQE